MRILRAKDYEEMSRKTAAILAAQVLLKPDSVLGLATGSTPVGAYQYLADWHKQADLDFSQCRSVNLDEYVGLESGSEQSYRWFMKHHLFDHINIDPANTYLPDGSNPDAEAECARYDALIRACGGIDLQLLGLGPNGHIGFNEPDVYFSSGTHKVALSKATIQANKRFFNAEDQVPRFAYTMGVRDILQARRVVMAVSGGAKARMVKEAFFGPVTPQIPASILQFHRDFILVADQEALSAL